MRKMRGKRILAAVLSLLMVFSMTGCGKDKNGDGGNPTPGNGPGGSQGGGQVLVDSSAAKEHVFREKPLTLPSELEKNNISYMALADGKLVLFSNRYTYNEETLVSTNEFFMTMMDADGSNAKTVAMSAPEGVSQDNWWIQQQFYSEKEKAFFGVMNYGYSESMPTPDPAEVAEEGEEPVYDDEYWNEYYASYVNVYSVAKWDINGETVWQQEVVRSSNEDWAYIRNAIEDQDGNLVLTIMGSANKQIVVSGKTGEIVSEKEMENAQMDEIDYYISNKDGKTFGLGYNDDYSKYLIKEYDVVTGKVGTSYEVPMILRSGNFFKGVTSDFVVATNTGLYTYNLGDTEANEFMNFLNSDVATSYFDTMIVTDDRHVIAAYNDEADDYKRKISMYEYVDPKDIPDKQTLVLGCNYLDSQIKSGIIKFNKSSDLYRIVVKDYSQYNTDEDYLAGINQLNNDIIGGKMPDILIPNEYYMNVDSFASKGLLVDLRALINQDSELSGKEYLTNVFDAYSKDGKMYVLPTSFNVQTYVAKTSLVGKPDKFTMQDAKAALQKMPDGAQIFGDMIQSSYLYQAINNSGTAFIDLANGKCNFNSPAFIEVLKDAKDYPKEFSDDYWNDYDYAEYQVQWRTDKTLLMSLYMYSISDMIYQIKGSFGEPVSFVGFPTDAGAGSAINSNGSMFCISAKSANVDGAWQFVRYYLTEDYQTSDRVWGFPVLKSAFFEQAKKGTEKPYWTDESGEKHEYEYSYWMNNEEITLDPFTQQEVDDICEFIYSLNTRSSYSDEIYNIITEETEAFFSGQKTAEAVADILQSRISIMLSEGM